MKVIKQKVKIPPRGIIKKLEIDVEEGKRNCKKREMYYMW